MELYSAACSELKRLCPRPVPPSLRLARLRVLAEFDPLLLSGMFNAPLESVEELVAKVGLLLRASSSGRCSVCGKKAREAWEFWSYIVEPRNGHGVAVLERVAPVCDKCLEALSFNPVYADKKRWKNVVKWLSKVNKVKKGRVEELLQMIADEYRLVAERTREWSVDVEWLGGHGIDHVLARVVLEKLVGDVYDMRGDMLVIHNTKLETNMLLIVEEDLNSFCGGAVDTAVLAARAMRSGLSPNWEGIEAYLDYLRDRNVCSKPLEKASLYIQGAWVAILRREQRAEAIRALVGMLNEDELVWTARIETPMGPVEKPEVRAFSPSVFSIDIVKSVAGELARALMEAGLRVVRLSFRPQAPTGELLPYSLYSYATAG